MTQKFYLHDASTAVGGILPATGSSQSATTPTVSATNSGTNRSMNGTIGTSQVAEVTVASGANTTAQTFWFRRFVSPPLAGQTVAAGTWNMRLAIQESNAAANFFATVGCLYFWRRSSGVIVGSRVLDAAATQVNSEAGTTETDTTQVSLGTGTAVTIEKGDVLIFELWGNTAAQGTATSRTNGVYYDGTTEGSVTSNAAYILAPADIPLFAPRKPAINFNDPAFF